MSLLSRNDSVLNHGWTGMSTDKNRGLRELRELAPIVMEQTYVYCYGLRTPGRDAN